MSCLSEISCLLSADEKLNCFFPDQYQADVDSDLLWIFARHSALLDLDDPD